jgi:hypothetical protein
VHMCTKFRFPMKVSETTGIQTFALYVGPPWSYAIETIK